MRTALLLSAALSALTLPALPQAGDGFSFHIRPGADIPLGVKSSLFDPDAPYALGASAAVSGQFALPRAPFLFVEGLASLGFHPTQASNELYVASAGAGLGWDARLADGLSLQLGAQGGATLAFYGASGPVPNPFGGASVGLVWDLSPGFALSAGASYRYHLGWDGEANAYTDLYQGAGAWVGTVLRASPAGGRRNVRLAAVEKSPLFPVFFNYYETHPFGSITVENRERSAISDVEAYFMLGEYMEQPKLLASLPSISSGGRADVPLTAIFSSRILALTEGAKAPAELRLSYTYLGRRFEQSEELTVDILDRNSMTWDDDRKAASFVTPRDPTVMIFSKNTAGLVRDQGANPLNLNFRIAMGLFEALRVFGLNYVIDPQSSYEESSRDALALDYLQFPSQSLTYRAGDCDDLSILFAALLESVGIETAFITVPGHIFMAFSIGMDETEARGTFACSQDLIYEGGKAWVPVETTLVQDGFLKAFKIAAKQWKEASERGEQGFIPIHEAWQTYRPVGYVGGSLSLLFPSVESVVKGYRSSLDAFVAQEIQPSVDSFESRIRGGGDKASLRNAYGILYARYGLFDEAIKQFKAALGQDRRSASAMINLANVYFLMDEMDEAIRWYESAAAAAPGNALAQAGLARSMYERERYVEAKSAHERLAAMDPSLAERYAYVGGSAPSVVRASAARERATPLWQGGEE